MNTPGLNHVILTVTDLAKSRAFYGDLLGFPVVDLPDYHTFFFPVGGVTIWFLSHAQVPAGDKFSEFRVGLDHLAFTAPDEAALHALVDKLRAAGVPTTGVEKFPTGNLYVVFRDPDNIQLEYWLNEPVESGA